VTDGQVRWEDGQTYFARGIKGFSINGLIRYFDTNTYYRQPVPEGKLQWQGPISVRDFQFAQANSPKPVKAVITGPYTLARLSKQGVYSSLPDLVMDLAGILNREAHELQKAGATFIQFDEPAILWHPEDWALFEKASAALTQGLRVKTALYTWFKDATAVGARLFRLPFDVYGLDLVMGGASEKLLKEFPRDKELGAGIVDARNTKLETVEEIEASLQRLARWVSPDRIYVNPSCGLEYLPRDRARAKLHRLVEGVRKAQEVLA